MIVCRRRSRSYGEQMDENNRQVFMARFAGVPTRVTCSCPSTAEHCRDYFITSASPAAGLPAPRISVDITGGDIEEMRRLNLRVEEAEGRTHVEFSYGHMEILALHKAVSDRLPAFDRVLFHCSAIEVGGRAVAFTAPSGTGKSTHSRLWKQVYGDEVSYINDDKPFIGIDGGELYVFGSPWMGKHSLGRPCRVPLAAIGLIVRDETNYVTRMAPGEVFLTIMRQIHRPADIEMMRRTTQIMKRIAETVPVHEIHCTMDPEAAQVSRAAILGDV